MIFCFSGTGNSRYIAQRIAEALQKTVIDLNARIKDNDTATPYPDRIRYPQQYLYPYDLR